MLEARDAFSLSILIMPVCRVGTGMRVFVIIKIMSYDSTHALALPVPSHAHLA